nr:FAD-dependent oxidoreductase [Sedimentibacter sp.]
MKSGFKKLISVALAAALVTGSLAGCSSQTSAPETAASSSSLKAGTYTGTGKGKNGDVKVEVTFDETSITGVKVLEHSETAGIFETPVEKIPQQIVENQSIMVDSVSGATYTSNAIIEAVKDCITQAGGKTEDFSKEIQTAAKEEEVYDTQLAIVGAGGAGLMAALYASEQDIDVIVLEKAATIGSSNAAVAGGPSTSSNRIQEAEGQSVSADQLYNYMYNYSQGTVNSLLLRKTIEAGGPMINKLLDMGLEATLRPDNYGVGFRARLKLPVKGEDRFKMVQNFVEGKGGQFLFETTGEHVITDEQGKVIGVTGTKADGTPVKVNADAVLLATGGYLGNKEMLAEHFGNVGIIPLGNTLSTGDGINMALEAGGVLEKNSFSLIFNEFAGENEKSEGWQKNDNLKYAIYGGLLVNNEGTRFMNEEIMATKPLAGGEEILRQGYFYSVIDEDYFNAMSQVGIWEFLGKPEDWYVGKMTQEGKVLKAVGERFDTAVKEGWAYKAETIEELAQYFGLENLPETVKEYNAMCEAGVDSTFGKSNYFMTSVDKGPYYVFQYQSSAWGTLGGVKVDDKLRVINADFEPIQGLYAAGVDAGSLFTTPYYGNEGAALGLSLSSGSVAGTEIADYIKGLK